MAARHKGLDELPQLASPGRTSIPHDKDFPKALYRVVGYRVAANARCASIFWNGSPI